MSQENVEIVRESIEAWNRRDFDTAIQSFDIEIEWRLPPVLAGESGRGPEEIKRFWEGLDEVFEDFQLEPQEFVDAGDHVAVRSHLLRHRQRERNRDRGKNALRHYPAGREDCANRVPR